MNIEELWLSIHEFNLLTFTIVDNNIDIDNLFEKRESLINILKKEKHITEQRFNVLSKYLLNHKNIKHFYNGKDEEIKHNVLLSNIKSDIDLEENEDLVSTLEVAEINAKHLIIKKQEFESIISAIKYFIAKHS